MPILNEQQIAEIEAREKKANQWSPNECDIRIDGDGDAFALQGATLGDTLVMLEDTYEGSGEDWDFIAHARTDVPALIETIRELQKKLQRIEQDGAATVREIVAIRERAGV